MVNKINCKYNRLEFLFFPFVTHHICPKFSDTLEINNMNISLITQGTHRLEKYLNLEGFLEKSMKIKDALKSTGKSCKCLEKALNSSQTELMTIHR